MAAHPYRRPAAGGYRSQRQHREKARAERRAEKIEHKAARRMERCVGHESAEDPSAGMAEPYSVEPRI